MTALLLTSATVVDTRDRSLAKGIDVLADDSLILDARPRITVPPGLDVTSINAHEAYIIPAKGCPVMIRRVGRHR